MKRYIETGILCLIYGALALVIINTDERSSYQLIYSTASFVSIGVLFYWIVYKLIPALFTGEEVRKMGWYQAGLIILFWMIGSLSYSLYWNDLVSAQGSDTTFLQIYSDIVIHKNVGQVLLFALITGSIYGFLRSCIVYKKKRLFRKTLTFSGIIFLCAGTFFGLKYAWDTSYKGSEDIIILDQEGRFQSLEEVLAEEVFQDKVVYVDLWYSTCSPCISDFKASPPVKTELEKEEDLVFLYLGRKTSHPNSRQLWVNVIKEYNLKGYHVYMSEALEAEMGQFIADLGEYLAYPRYLLVNRQGEVISWDAPAPDSREPFVTTLREAINGQYQDAAGE